MVEAQQQQTSSSNPSIDAAPTLRKKPRATYGSRRRQPESGSEAEAEAAGNSSSTGRFSSPVSRLFDSSPQRPLSKHRAVTIADERDADEAAHRRRRSGESDRTGAADTSYTTTASSVHGDDDDEDHVLPEVGKARKLLDESDEESDDEPEDDEAFLARFRAQQTATQAPNATTEVGSPKGLAPARSSPSDLFSGSLSSAPPALAARSSQSDMFSGSLSSAPLTSSQDRLAGDEATDSSQLLVIPGLRQGRGSAPAPASSDSLEADGERQPSLERGSKQNSNQPSSDAEHQQKKAKAGRSTLAARMKSRKGRALLSSDSEQEHPSARDSASLSPTAALHRNRRACVVATVYSEDEDSDADLDEAARENRQEERTREKEAARKARMHSMAARARDRAGTSAYDANDVNALGTTEDVNHATDNGAASADSDGDSLPDVLAAARNAAQNAQAKNSRIAAEQAVRDRASAKVQGKRRKTLDLEESSAAGLDDGERRRKTTGSGTKPLTKRELEEMHRMTAKLEREQRISLARSAAAQGYAKRRIGVSDLLAKINKSEQPVNVKHDRLGQSQSTSDPIESDPPRSVKNDKGKGHADSPGRGGSSSPLFGAAIKISLRSLPRTSDQHEDTKNMSLLDLDFDAELPDPRAALDRMMADKERKEKAAALKAIKERALRAASAPSRPLRSGSIVPPATRKEVLSDGDSDIEIYRAVVQPEHKPALGAAQSPPMSSDRNKARVDKLFRTLGVKPKTPHKANRPKGVRANANGSPGASSEHFGSDDLAAEDWVTDSQLFAASKTFGVASAIASGHRPPPSHSRHVRAKESTPAVEGPPPDENKGEPTAAEHRTTRRRGAIAMTRDQLNATVLKKAQLQNIKVRAKKEEVATSRRGRTQNAAPKEEETPTSAGPDVAEMLRKVQANADIDEGPDEDGDEDEDDPDFIMPQIEDAAEALGSGSDGPDVEDEAGSGASDAESEKENEEEEGDSEKENVSPQTSQQSQRQLSSRALMDEDEDEAPGMLASRRARGRAIFSDDEDDAPARRELPPLSNSQERALRPLRTSGAYSSGTQSQPLEVGGLMSPAASPDPDRRLRAVSAEPSPPGPQGFTQFFQPTPPETEAAAVQRASGHSVFGQFFEPTQVPDATGSGRAAAGASPPVGFTQLFADGIPLLSKSGDRRDSASGDAPDAFAQLREAQQIGGLVDSPSVLPSLNISAADLEGDEGALMRGEQARKRATKQYLNKDGFFTQTRPTTLFDSQPQSQSQIDWEAQRPGEPSAPRSDARLMTSSSRMSPTQAPTPSMAESPRSPSQRKLMRLVRRPAPPPTSEDGKNESKEDAASDVEESEHEGGEQTPEDEVEDAEDDFQPAQGQQLPSAWDILRRGAANPLPVKNADKRKDRFNFVEGEAVESDDEEGPVGRGGGGGLRGVWSDDDADSVRGSGDEEDGSDDDRDLEGLVHDEHEDDEIAKDRLARERYHQDLEKDDAEALALHEKVARGALRNKRRGGAGADLENFLDDDWDEEDLRRRAANPRALMRKKRRLEGEDAMERLAQDEESQAFVLNYSETHQVGDDERDKYDWLAAQDDSDDEGAEEGESQPLEKITHEQLKRELQQRRAKKRAAPDSDDEEREAEPDVHRNAGAWSDDDDADITPYVRDRLSAAKAEAAKKAKVADSAASAKAVRMAFDKQAVAPDEDEGESVDPTFAFLDVTRPMTAKERERLERFAKEAKDESQWGTSESMGSASGGGSRGSTITGYSMAKSTKRDAGTGSTFDRIREQKRRAGHDKVKSRLAGFLHRGGQFTNASESQ